MGPERNARPSGRLAEADRVLSVTDSRTSTFDGASIARHRGTAQNTHSLFLDEDGWLTPAAATPAGVLDSDTRQQWGPGRRPQAHFALLKTRLARGTLWRAGRADLLRAGHTRRRASSAGGDGSKAHFGPDTKPDGSPDLSISRSSTVASVAKRRPEPKPESGVRRPVRDHTVVAFDGKEGR